MRAACEKHARAAMGKDGRPRGAPSRADTFRGLSLRGRPCTPRPTSATLPGLRSGGFAVRWYQPQWQLEAARVEAEVREHGVRGLLAAEGRAHTDGASRRQLPRQRGRFGEGMHLFFSVKMLSTAAPTIRYSLCTTPNWSQPRPLGLPQGRLTLLLSMASTRNTTVAVGLKDSARCTAHGAPTYAQRALGTQQTRMPSRRTCSCRRS
jgi:hypothetical protein